MTDWNWFFSSLAQSAAAIVGIFGAFIITKVLSNQSVYSQKLSHMRELLNHARRLVEDAEDHSFKWYIHQCNRCEIDHVAGVLKDNPDLSPEECYAKLNFPIFDPREKAISLIREKIEAVKGSRCSALPNMSLLDPEFRGKLEKEREAIDLTIRNARSHIRSIKTFLDTVYGNPESSLKITYTLLLITTLFFVGVVYPLSFLPANPNTDLQVSIDNFLPLLFSLRGILLAAISIIFSSVIVMFFITNLRMRYPKSLVGELERYTDLSAYSEYFRIMEENKKIKSA